MNMTVNTSAQPHSNTQGGSSGSCGSYGKILPLDQAWRLKCYLASLSWYQKHLIIETKEISEILIQASYDYDHDYDLYTGSDDPEDLGVVPGPGVVSEDMSQCQSHMHALPLSLTLPPISEEYVHINDNDNDGSTEIGIGIDIDGDDQPSTEVSAEQLAYMNFYLDAVDKVDRDSSNAGRVEEDVDSDTELEPNRDMGVGVDMNVSVRPIPSVHNDLLQSAVKGNQTAQQELLKWFLPPPFAASDDCSECRVPFSIRSFRHHCRHCGQSFCSKHASKYHRIHKFGFATGTVRVCAPCYDIIEREEYRDRSLWRVLRLKAYYKHDLIHYFERRVDRTVDKVVRYVCMWSV